MLSSSPSNARDQKLLELALEAAAYLNTKKYAKAERLLQGHLTPQGIWSEYPKKGSRPVAEAIFFEQPKKFRAMFSAEKPAEQHEDLYFTLLESIKNTKVATVSLFEMNTEMKSRAQAELDKMKDYAEVLGQKGCPGKQGDLMEIYNELQPKLAAFNINVLRVEADFADRIHQLKEVTQQNKQPHLEQRQKSREQALQHKQNLEEKRAPESELHRIGTQLLHLDSDSLAEMELELKERDEALLIDRDRRRSMQKLPAAEDKLKSLNFKLEVMETLHNHDKTLNEHRTSKFIRGFVNGMSLILLGLPWLAHKALTGNWLFFNKTTSQEKIEQVDHALRLDEVPAQMKMTGA